MKSPGQCNTITYPLRDTPAGKHGFVTTLNTAQQTAVTAGGGPALVLAGAGTGKTRVIVERMAWLIEERGVDPRHLLALTFTNKAAAEMRARLARRTGADRVASWMGTFHSFALYMLRRERDRLGRPSNFTIFDDADQLSLMKRLVKELPPRVTRVSPREGLQYISSWKQRAESPPDLENPDTGDDPFLILWRRYHDALDRARALDFDGLLVETVRLFEENEDVRDKYRRRFRYVLVDEYQDTNHAQYRIARALAGPEGNLFAVGDEDQSIYAWRGADIRNILDFERDFPNAQVHRLEQNYRSTAPILELANAVVANNTQRLGKKLWTSQDRGEPVRFHLAESAEEEARWVADAIVRGAMPASEVAVLFRTNAQARVLEEALRLRGIHYAVVGGVKFYQRKEVKDILAYLRLIVNPADDESVRRIINVPARGIGATTMERIEEYAAQRGCPLVDVLREIDTDTTLGGRARASVAALLHLLDDWREKEKDAPVAALAEAVLEAVDYRAYVQHTDERDFRNRLEIVDEFIAGCRQHDASRGGRLEQYLQDLALMTDVDAWDADAPAVTLMTVHSAKGLEFGEVYIVGLEEGLFPLIMEFEDGHNLEEERRLCYVAMTRAKQRLTLTAAQSRMIYGKLRDDREVSRFVAEAGYGRLKREGEKKPAGKARRTSAAGEKAEPGGMRVGSRVRHAKFGPGRVMEVSGSGRKMKARIKFQTGRSMTFMVSVAPLEIVEG